MRLTSASLPFLYFRGVNQIKPRYLKNTGSAMRAFILVFIASLTVLIPRPSVSSPTPIKARAGFAVVK